MALSDYWKNGRTRQDAAFRFLRSGSNAYNPLRIAGAQQQGCLDSSNCGSGFACVGGYCVQKDTGAGKNSYGDPTGCGDPDDGDDGGGGGGGQCAPGTYDFIGGEVGKCLKTGCGDDGGRLGRGPGACCGKGRCCRFDAYGNVQCFCGNCPEPPDYCNKWCNDYLSATGESGEGCDDDSVCDECSDCLPSIGDGNANRCRNVGGGPCHCPNSSCDGDCEECGDDGICEVKCENCQRCYRTYKECWCGTVEVICCYSSCDESKGYTECREGAKCDDYCPPGAPTDPCDGSCDYITVCDEAPPPCPPKSTCSTVGNIQVGERECNIIKVCDKSKVSEDCGECDCNCDQDCPDCMICNASTGKCEPDPACDDNCNKRKRWLITSTYAPITYSSSYCDCVGVPNQFWNPGGSQDECLLPPPTVNYSIRDGIGGFCNGTGFPADMEIKIEIEEFTTYLSDFSEAVNWCVPGPGSATRTITRYYGLGANACATSNDWGFLFALNSGPGYSGTLWVPPRSNNISTYNASASVQYSDCNGVFSDAPPGAFPAAPPLPYDGPFAPS